MKVALAFLPKITLNAIQVSFAVNLPLLSFFSFILFILIFYSIYVLFSFLLSVLLYLRSQFHQCWLWKENLYVYLTVQKVQARSKNLGHSLQLTDLCYILLPLLCWMKNISSCSWCVFTFFLSQNWKLQSKKWL